MQKSGLDCALEMAAKMYRGLPLTIPTEWAQELIEKHQLVMATGRGDMSGEQHALFQHNGETIRLKLAFPHRYELFHGEWQRDPHWTGD